MAIFSCHLVPLLVINGLWRSVGAILAKPELLERKTLGTGKSANLCINGRLAPELILLGAAKATTSLFAKNFNKSSDVRFPACLTEDNRGFDCGVFVGGVKEMHFFNHEDRFEKGLDFWLQHYPNCDQNRRVVATDLTPVYLQDPAVPDRLSQFYGEQIANVKFLVLLREPIECMQSYFYYDHKDKIHSFQDWAQSLIAKDSARQGYLFLNSMYAPQLQMYFEKFDPSQFIIVPMKYNIARKNGQKAFFEFLWEKFGLAPPDDGEATLESYNEHQHTPLVDDLDSDTLSKFQQLVDGMTGARVLAQTLASEGRRGPMLYGYDGAADDIEAIASWLSDGW